MNKLLAALAALAMAVTGCSSGGERMTDAQARTFAMAHVSPPDAAMRVGMLYRTLDEALPNVAYVHPTHGEHNFSDLAVIGTITDVDKGRGWKSNGGDGAITDFDSKDAAWRSLHMTVAVERAIGTPEPPKEVRVALASPPPDEFDAMAQRLKAMGRVVMFLDKGSPLVTYDPSLYVIVEDGGLWATIGPNGELDLPFVEAGRKSRLLAVARNVADLERLGAARRVIPTTGPQSRQRRLDA